MVALMLIETKKNYVRKRQRHHAISRWIVYGLSYHSLRYTLNVFHRPSCHPFFLFFLFSLDVKDKIIFLFSSQIFFFYLFIFR